MWYPVDGYVGLYEVHLNGAVRNARSRRVLSPICGRYVLSNRGVVNRIPVHEVLRSIPADAIVEVGDVGVEQNKYSELFPWKSSGSLAVAGDAGEYLVCYELTMRGIKCAANVIQGAPYDVIGDFGGGELFRIQVKTNIKPVIKENKMNPEVAYKFGDLSGSRGACDIFAFVALDRRLVMFELAKATDVGSRSFSVNSFVARQKDSIDTTLMAVYGKVGARG